MAPLVPHWTQPSHGEIQEVVIGKEGYTSKSFSKATVPPFGLFAKMNFPPCTRAMVPTYATVQMDRDAHLNLNSDIVYINHSCEPSLIFDMPSLSILAGPMGLRPGVELTFFYPSTEWRMAQSFECFCATATCRGRIAGAADMSAKRLEGMWLNGYIREMLEERDFKEGRMGVRNGTGMADLGGRLGHWHVQGRGEAAGRGGDGVANGRGSGRGNGNGGNGRGTGRGTVGEATEVMGNGVGEVGAGRTGPTSRELSGEMGGDTKAI